ncbi:MAG: hypothetical protein MK227_00385 [Nitrososphaerales archaeon]|nr:hypothetical protein [Nitrososphaerales archaeon]
MARNWLDPFNFTFALSFLFTGLLFPFPALDSSSLLVQALRLGMIFLGLYLVFNIIKKRRIQSKSN